MLERDGLTFTMQRDSAAADEEETCFKGYGLQRQWGPARDGYGSPGGEHAAQAIRERRAPAPQAQQQHAECLKCWRASAGDGRNARSESSCGAQMLVASPSNKRGVVREAHCERCGNPWTNKCTNLTFDGCK